MLGLGESSVTRVTKNSHVTLLLPGVLGLLPWGMLMDVSTEDFLGKSLWAPWRDPTPPPPASVKVPLSLCVGDAQGDSGLPFTGQSVGNWAPSAAQKVLGSYREELCPVL